MVTVKMDGQKSVLGVTIDPEAAGDAEMLQDMVMAAFNEAHKKVEERDAAEDERHARRHGSAAGPVLIDARFRRAARAADSRDQAPARHRTEVGAADRVSRAAHRTAKTSSGWRRRCST